MVVVINNSGCQCLCVGTSDTFMVRDISHASSLAR